VSYHRVQGSGVYARKGPHMLGHNHFLSALGAEVAEPNVATWQQLDAGNAIDVDIGDWPNLYRTHTDTPDLAIDIHSE
jgi:hypothetical protein